MTETDSSALPPQTPLDLERTHSDDTGSRSPSEQEDRSVQPVGDYDEQHVQTANQESILQQREGFTEKLTKKEEEVNEYTQQLESMRAEKEKVERELEKERQTNQRQMEQILRLNEEVIHAMEEKMRLQRRIQEQEGQMEEMNTGIDSPDEPLMKIRNERELLESVDQEYDEGEEQKSTAGGKQPPIAHVEASLSGLSQQVEGEADNRLSLLTQRCEENPRQEAEKAQSLQGQRAVREKSEDLDAPQEGGEGQARVGELEEKALQEANRELQKTNTELQRALEQKEHAVIAVQQEVIEAHTQYQSKELAQREQEDARQEQVLRQEQRQRAVSCALQKNNERLRATIAEYEQAAQGHLREIAELREELLNRSALIESLGSLNAALEARRDAADALSARLAEAQETAEVRRQENQSLRSSCSQLKREKEEAVRRVGELREQCEGLEQVLLEKEEKEATLLENRELVGKVLGLTELLSEKEKEMEGMRAREEESARVDGENRRKQEALEAMIEEYDGVVKRMTEEKELAQATYQEEVEAVRARLVEAERVKEEKERRVAELEDEKRGLETQLEAQAQSYVVLAESLQKCQDERGELLRVAEERKREEERLTRERREKEEEMGKRMEKERDVMKKAMDVLKAEKERVREEMEEDVKRVKEELEEVKRMEEEKEEELEKVREELEEVKRMREEKEEEMKRVREELEMMLEKKEREMREEREQMEQLNGVVGQMKEEKEQAAEALQRLRQQMEDVAQRESEVARRHAEEVQTWEVRRQQLEDENARLAASLASQQELLQHREVSPATQPITQPDMRDITPPPDPIKPSMLPPEDSALYSHFSTSPAPIEIVDIDPDDVQPRLSALTLLTAGSETTVSSALTEEELALVEQLSSTRVRLNQCESQREALEQRVWQLEREESFTREALREKEGMIDSLTLSFNNQNETIRLLQQTLQALRSEQEQTRLLLDGAGPLSVLEEDVVVRVKENQMAIVLARSGRIVQSGLRELSEMIREYDSEVAAYRMTCDFWRKQLEGAQKKIRRMESLKGRMEEAIQEQESQLRSCYKCIKDAHPHVD